MARYVRRTLEFNTGKQIRLYSGGNCTAVDKSLRIGEGMSLIYFPVLSRQGDSEKGYRVYNPNSLSVDEVMELADLNIGLWEKLKAHINKYGMDSPKIFNGRPS